MKTLKEEVKRLIKTLVLENDSDSQEIKRIADAEWDDLQRNKEALEDKRDQQILIIQHMREVMADEKQNAGVRWTEEDVEIFESKLKSYESHLRYYNGLDKDALYKAVAERYHNEKRYEQEYQQQRAEKLSSGLTKEGILDAFVTSLEGGSNYWYFMELPRSIKGSSDAIGDYILKGGTINFYDTELWRDIVVAFRAGEYNLDQKRLDADKEEAFLGYVDMDKILEAISLLKEDYPEVYENIVLEDCDGDCADTFLQLAVMGEVVFG
jgi:hypothetical protein